MTQPVVIGQERVVQVDLPPVPPLAKREPPYVVAHAHNNGKLDPKLPFRNPDLPKGEGEAYGDRG